MAQTGSRAQEFEAFLEAALPPLGLSPVACRRRNIRRRLTRRMEELGFHEFARYLHHVRRAPEENLVLRSLLLVTISRFFRNKRVFDSLAARVLPELSKGGTPVRAWSAGCASGEEAFTLRILWEELPDPKPSLFLLATDIDDDSLSRAREGTYGESSLREVPRALRGKYFVREGAAFRIRQDLKEGVQFRRHDLLSEDPPGTFDLILCRNSAFTYFGPEAQLSAARSFASALSPSGRLVLGRTERLPVPAEALFEPVHPAEKIFRVLPEG